jgi:predicted  nucleic acid-binding Zn-ribbon protein
VTELETLVQLQEHDTRIAALEAEAARLPREIAALQAALGDARKAVDAARTRLDAARKELRAREKDLDDLAVKRSRAEAKLYEVKTNVEYSAMLAEIEHIKAQKAQAEEEILALMERQEGLALEIREAEARIRDREEQARRDEAVIRDKLGSVERELQAVRGERASLAGQLPRPLLTDYERIQRARGGLAVVPVSSSAVCGGCRMAIRPQAIQEIRSGALLHCESCGRYLYWQE